MLIAGFSSGVFGLYELPGLDCLHTLSIAGSEGVPVTTVDLNCSGEWLAFGCAHLGQMLVWEWQSETCELLSRLVDSHSTPSAGPQAACLSSFVWVLFIYFFIC